ncbi:MAG: ABC transporter substrate-binding protein [Eubacterium sp.]|nr:ABC transporter substrate-binding protein [Eubacterium sp.]
MMKKLVALLLSVSMVFALTACGGSDGGSAQGTTGDGEKKITIAYQGGIGYAPIHVMEEKDLIEANYDGEIEVEFVKLDSGAAINEGIIGGTIDIGCMGLGPAISGVAAGVPYKAISNLCSQSHGLMSNDPSIKSLADIKTEDKIALVNTGSIQHILLAMAAEKNLGDAHALDNNIQAMSHAEGMAALESGTVKLHLTSSPFIYQERENAAYNELPEINEVWPSGNSFLLAMASNKVVEDEKLNAAVLAAFDQAFEFINSDKEGLAEIEVEYLALDHDTVMSYLNEKDCQFFPQLRGADDMASFMYSAGFVTKEVSMDEFKHNNVVVE